MDVVRAGLVKGCLGGLAMVVVFFVISGLTYWLLSQTSLSREVVLVLAIASGPAIGTAGVLGPIYIRARRALNAPSTTDETAAGDAP